MRLTLLRREILAFLSANRIPVTLEMIATAPNIRGKCDDTTIYRTLALFKAVDVVRLIGTPEKASRFVLNVPDNPHHFLICRRCGCIRELVLPAAVAENVRQIAAENGFESAFQDYEVIGLCEACNAVQENEGVPTKLKVY